MVRAISIAINFFIIITLLISVWVPVVSGKEE